MNLKSDNKIPSFNFEHLNSNGNDNNQVILEHDDENDLDLDLEQENLHAQKDKLKEIPQTNINKPSKVGKLNLQFLNKKDSKNDSKSDFMKSFNSNSQNEGMESIIIED